MWWARWRRSSRPSTWSGVERTSDTCRHPSPHCRACWRCISSPAPSARGVRACRRTPGRTEGRPSPTAPTGCRAWSHRDTCCEPANVGQLLQPSSHNQTRAVARANSQYRLGVTCWRRAASWVLLWCENSMLACMAARERHSSSVKATTIIVPLSPASLTSHQPRGLRERAMTSSPPTQHKTNKALIFALRRNYH